MTLRPISSVFRDRSEWPTATCPVEGCGYTRPHPVGGTQVCDDCRQKRSAEVAQRELEQAATERQARLERLPGLLAAAGCPKRYQRFTRAAWEASFGPWQGPLSGRLDGWTGEIEELWLVLLYGLYGRRKTSLATALLGERIVAGKRCVWLDAADWARRMQAAIGRKDLAHAETPEGLYESAERAEVLLLDDLGAILGAREGRRAEQTWWCEQLALLLRSREAWIRPTIVTANIEEVRELARIDESLVSRCDVPLAFKLSGPDYRQGMS